MTNRLTDEAAAQIMWANLCCAQPVGCSDGGTYFVQAPTQAEFVAKVYPALAQARAEGKAEGMEAAAMIARDTAENAEHASNTADYVDEMVELGKARAAYQILAAIREAKP